VARRRSAGRVKVIPRALFDLPRSDEADAYIREHGINPLTLLRWTYYQRLVEWGNPKAGTYFTESDLAEIATWKFAP
jgi:hypothetical protein